MRHEEQRHLTSPNGKQKTHGWICGSLLNREHESVWWGCRRPSVDSPLTRFLGIMPQTNNPACSSPRIKRWMFSFFFFFELPPAFRVNTGACLSPWGFISEVSEWVTLSGRGVCVCVCVCVRVHLRACAEIRIDNRKQPHPISLPSSCQTSCAFCFHMTADFFLFAVCCFSLCSVFCSQPFPPLHHLHSSIFLPFISASTLFFLAGLSGIWWRCVSPPFSPPSAHPQTCLSVYSIIFPFLFLRLPGGVVHRCVFFFSSSLRGKRRRGFPVLPPTCSASWAPSPITTKKNLMPLNN